MNEHELENKIEDRWGEFDRHRGQGRIWAGLFLLIIGGFLLLKTLNIILFPVWFFSWPMILIALGLFTGLRHGFRGGAWMVLLLVGGIFLINQVDPSLQLGRYIFPFIIMAIGLMFIVRPRRNHWRRWERYQRREWRDARRAGEQVPASGTESEPLSADRRDFVDITAVFSGVKKNIVSKNFKGGDIVSFMGGSEINLTQADFTGQVKIDATNVFGGTKLIIPPTWYVQNDIAAIFGGVEDKRFANGIVPDINKTLILDGTCMFGGIEIRSY